MAIYPKYTINTTTNQGTLDIYNEALYLTTYSFDNTMVTLSERSNTDVLLLSTLYTNLESISSWIFMIDSYLSVTKSVRSHYKEEMDKGTSVLNGKYFHTNSKITDIKFDLSSKEVTFKPRSLTSMNFTDFKAWYSYLRRFYTDSYLF